MLLKLLSTGRVYPVTSEQAQRLLDEYPAMRATKHRVVLQGHNTSKASERTVLSPATLGGGPTFVIER